jgi:uncharacterized cupredoxin-like copper-binding protein
MTRLAMALALILGSAVAAYAAGDLTRQEPIDVRVDLGDANDAMAFDPPNLTFETGKLYRLVLHNPSPNPHYFTSAGLADRVFTRKVQIVESPDRDAKRIGEIKGAIRDIEVFPGATIEWWFVPVATGKLEDLHCHVEDDDGKTHAEKGMVGRIVIE